MENSNKIGNVLKLLLVLLSGFSLYFLFNMNKSLSDVKENLVDAQKEVGKAQECVRVMQLRVDSMFNVTKNAKAQIEDLKQKANQVKTVYIDRTKKDDGIIKDGNDYSSILQQRKERFSKLKWAPN